MSVNVVQSFLCSVQDGGRAGFERDGVPAGGAMDRCALAAANLLVGNGPDAAAIEIVGGAAVFRATEPLVFALAGGDFDAFLGERRVPLYQATMARRGALIRIGARRSAWGARVYLALAGGVDVPPVLGGRGTFLPGGFGGHDGRLLRPGDTLRCGQSAEAVLLAGATWPVQHRPVYGPTPTLRVLPGPHAKTMPEALAALCATTFTVSADSNRMGYRLLGTSLGPGPTIDSQGVFPGVIQLPPNGTPVLLMADAQTVGGYPILAVVISADLPLAAQLLPGDALRFALTDDATALAAYRQMIAWRSYIPDHDDDLVAPGWAGG